MKPKPIDLNQHLDLINDMAVLLNQFCDIYNCNEERLQDNGIDWWYMHKTNRRAINLIETLKDECMFKCNNCHEHFSREEMDFDTDADCDLCKNCNHETYNEAPYGEDK